MWLVVGFACSEDDSEVETSGDFDQEAELSETEEAPVEQPGRPADPVVVTGEDLTPLLGFDPDTLAAYRLSEETGEWERIPLQVDERHETEYREIYNQQEVRAGLSLLVYSDTNTLAGTDPETGIDEDDELVFMTRDTGMEYSDETLPEGVKGSGIEVKVSDPGNASFEGWVYLFTLEEGADVTEPDALGTYEFSLENGVYPDDYGFHEGPNPEDSWFKSALYERHFSDRWIGDGMAIKTEGSSGVDILDLHQDQFLPGLCSRSVVTFSDGEGAFVTNKQGPVRSIRSYVGANSGPLTQRTHLFYEGREDIITDLRVHEISSMYDYFDFSAEAIGMTYSTEHFPEGVIIDGVADAIEGPMPAWERVQGEPGGLIIIQRYSTNLELKIESYYVDENPAEYPPCYGDDAYYGSCGSAIPLSSEQLGIPCTDPKNDCDGILQAIRIVYYETPDVTIAQAEEYSRGVDEPFRAELREM